MIGLYDLDDCYNKLFVYDVTQHGWEHEAKGFTVNMGHMLTHLAKDSFRKSFKDEVTSEEILAPDSLAYALRICRWGNVQPKQLISSSSTAEHIVETRVADFPGMPKSYVAHKAGTDAVADIIHDEGHASSNETATAQRLSKCLEAGRFLLYCANLQAVQFRFDLSEAFDMRLSELRILRNIPDPV